MHGMFVLATFQATRVSHNIIEEYRDSVKYIKTLAILCLGSVLGTILGLATSKTTNPFEGWPTALGVIVSIALLAALTFRYISYRLVSGLLKKKRAYLLHKHFEGLLDFVLFTHGQYSEKNRFLRWVAADKERYDRLIEAYLEWRNRLPQTRTQVFGSLSGCLMALVQDFEDKA